MTLKDQWNTIKENWIISVLIIVVLGLVLFKGGVTPYGSSLKLGGVGMEAAYDVYDSRAASIMPPSYQADFAPDVLDRKIIKTSSLSTEVERGTFQNAEAQMKSVVQSSGSFILNENVNKYDNNRWTYYNGWYSIKVPSDKYVSVLTQLRSIGEVKSFNENADDVTGSYTDLQVELEAEKARLTRYQAMYDEATLVADKITLNDKIFDQERRIKYIEESLKNTDTQIEYTTISFSITEKQSEYVNIMLVKFSELVRSVVDSFNGLLKLIFVIIPYAVVLGIILLIRRIVKDKKSRR